jgi:hypothetical protein
MTSGQIASLTKHMKSFLIKFKHDTIIKLQVMGPPQTSCLT